MLRGLLSLAAFLAAGTVSAAERSGNYLIIVAEEFEAAAPLTQFIDARAADGFSVSTYSVAPGTSNTAVKSYIASLWQTPDAPDYILIVGDTPAVPHWSGGGSKHAPTDLPYACMDGGDDWYPDIPIGRFSVSTVAQLQAVVDKTLFIEAGVFSDPDYVRRGAFLANPSTYGQAEPTHDWVIENYFEPNDYQGIRIYAAEGGDTQDVTDAVNNGCLWVVYFGHSGTYGWSSPTFNQDNVRALSNEGLYGLAFGFSCNTANYPADECFGETWIREASKGAAAYISASTLIYWGSVEAWQPSVILEKSFYASFFEDRIWEVGPAWNNGLYRFLDEFGAPDYPGGPPTQNEDIVRNFFEEFVLLGDPALLLPQPWGFTIDAEPVSQDLCCPPDHEAVYRFDATPTGGFDEPVTLSASGAPAGSFVSFSVNSVVPPFATLMTVGGLGSAATGTYDIQVTGSAPTYERSMSVALSIANSAPGDVALVSPPDGAVDVSRRPTLTWEAASQAVDYELEIATTADFTDIVHAAVTAEPSYTLPFYLDSLTLHYWHVRALNGCGDGSYSPTFSFTTIEQADYFTEEFGFDFDLEYFTAYFVPDGSASFYAMCGAAATEFPTDPAGGTPLSLADDSSEYVTLSDGQSVQLYGVAYAGIYVGSNGYVTFTGHDSDYSETLTDHFDMPRISLLFDDLNPSQGGTISWRQLADRAAVTYQNVPEYGTGNSNSFQVELFYDGAIRLTWLGVDVNDAIIGLSAGGGLPGDYLETDLSAAGACVAVCCHGYVCYDVDPLDPQDAHNQAQCLADGGAYYTGVSCADNMCDCGGADYRGDANCLGDGVDSYDIDHFIQAVGAPADWLATHTCGLYCANDVNCDGEVNSYDIDGFILCIGQGICEPCP